MCFLVGGGGKVVGFLTDETWVWLLQGPWWRMGISCIVAGWEYGLHCLKYGSFPITSKGHDMNNKKIKKLFPVFNIFLCRHLRSSYCTLTVHDDTFWYFHQQAMRCVAVFYERFFNKGSPFQFQTPTDLAVDGARFSLPPRCTSESSGNHYSPTSQSTTPER